MFDDLLCSLIVHPTKDFNAFGSIPWSPPGFCTPAIFKQKKRMEKVEIFILISNEFVMWYWKIKLTNAKSSTAAFKSTAHYKPPRSWTWMQLKFNISWYGPKWILQCWIVNYQFPSWLTASDLNISLLVIENDYKYFHYYIIMISLLS